MRVCKPGYWLEVDRKEKIARIWSFAGDRVVAVIDLLKREVIWSEEEIEVEILCEDIHIKPKKRGSAASASTTSPLVSFSDFEL